MTLYGYIEYSCLSTRINQINLNLFHVFYSSGKPPDIRNIQMCASVFLESIRFRRNFDITICYLQLNTLNCCNWKSCDFRIIVVGNLFLFCSNCLAIYCSCLQYFIQNIFKVVKHCGSFGSRRRAINEEEKNGTFYVTLRLSSRIKIFDRTKNVICKTSFMLM